MNSLQKKAVGSANANAMERKGPTKDQELCQDSKKFHSDSSTADHQIVATTPNLSFSGLCT